MFAFYVLASKCFSRAIGWSSTICANYKFLPLLMQACIRVLVYIRIHMYAYKFYLSHEYEVYDHNSYDYGYKSLSNIYGLCYVDCFANIPPSG